MTDRSQFVYAPRQYAVKRRGGLGEIFRARPSADGINVTGDSSLHRIQWATVDSPSTDVSLDAASGIVTINKSGTYVVTASAYVSGSGGADVRFYLRKNGATRVGGLNFQTGLPEMGPNLGMADRFVKGDTLDVAIEVRGSTKNYDALAARSAIQLARVTS